MGFPPIFKGDEYAFCNITGAPDCTGYSYHGASFFVLECEVDMGSAYRKFWTGFNGTQEYEVEV